MILNTLYYYPIRIRIEAIQVVGVGVQPIIASRHTIRVEHRHYLEDEISTKNFALLVVRAKQGLERILTQ